MALQLHKTDGAFWIATAVLLALFVVTLGFHFVDRRSLAGDGVWAKPLKFQISLAVHFATLAAVASVLSPIYRNGGLLFATAIAAIACAAFEITYIGIQAARLQPSHFNVSTPFYAFMYVAMAVGAVVITLAAAAFGIAAWFDRDASISATVQAATALGLVGGAILTLIVAFRMGSAMNHHVGQEIAAAARVPLTGWSRSVGDLRVPHFLATHMMQAVPAAGLLIERFASGLTALVLVCGFAAFWTALTWLAFVRSLGGHPFP